MGGAIATLYVDRKSKTTNSAKVNKLALCAPMFGINMPKWLSLIARPLTKFCAAVKHPANHAIGQKPYKEKPTEMKLLTHSKMRFDLCQKLYEQNEYIQVGGPSAQWIWQSLLIKKQIFAAASNIQLPILLLQGGKDKIVSNEDMFKFHHIRQAANLPIKFEIHADGLHELLFEQDEIRDTVLNQILDFAHT